MKDWIELFRLRTLPLSLSGALVAGGLAKMNDVLDWGVFALLAITIVLLQILSNVANDLGDGLKGTDNSDRVGPKRGFQSGKFSKKQLTRAVFILSLLSIISGFGLLYMAFGDLDFTFLLFFVLGLLSILAAIKYTMGKKAFGYSGKGDVFVFIFFGVLSVMGGSYLFLGEFYWDSIYPAITIGCFSVAVLNLNNMRDIENDEKVGKITLAVRLGFLDAKLYHFIVVIIGMSSVAFFNVLTGNFSLTGFLPILAFIPISLHLNRVNNIRKPEDFDPELKKVALSTFLFSILFAVSMFL
jgi:1,4-dihydroxy-2-naphthoate polyprenyltransferase